MYLEENEDFVKSAISDEKSKNNIENILETYETF